MCGDYMDTVPVPCEKEAGRKKGLFLAFWALYFAGLAILLGWIMSHLLWYESLYPTFP